MKRLFFLLGALSVFTLEAAPTMTASSLYELELAEDIRLDAEADRLWQRAVSSNEVAALQARVKDAFRASIGEFPARTPLDVRKVGEERFDGYRVEKLVFASRPNYHVPAHLYLPDSPRFAAPYPAILMPCGHDVEGKAEPVHARAAVVAANAGYAALLCDPIDEGERRQRDGDKMSGIYGHRAAGLRAHLLGENMAMYRVWDGMRAIDLLLERADIDPTRIGCAGFSGGGTLTSYMNALDDRIRCASPSAFITSIPEIAKGPGPQDSEQVIFGQLKFGLNHLGFLLLCAPNPILPGFSYDDFFPFAGSKETLEKATAWYAAHGWEDRLDHLESAGRHGWYESEKFGLVRWMDRWLKDDKSALPFDRDELNRLNAKQKSPELDYGLGLKTDPRALCCGGNVRTLPGEKTIFDLLKGKAREVEAARPELSPAIVARVLGLSKIPEAHPPFVRATFATNEADVCVMTVENAVDYDRGVQKFWYRQGGAAEELAVMMMWRGENLIAREVEDVLLFAQSYVAAHRPAKVLLKAKGDAAIAAAHAYYLHPECFAGIELEDPPPSWKKSFEDPFLALDAKHVVYGAYRHYDWVDLLPHPSLTTLIAHRGESYDAPENTLPAYKTAVERGFGFECDIYLSKDGRLFTFHDPDLTRTTDGANTNACTDVTWDEVKACNVGGWGKWKGSTFDGTRPALLEEVLELARPGRKIYVEVKGGNASVGWVSTIRETLRRCPKANPETVLFIAFGDETCAELKRQMPEYKVYWLCSQSPKRIRSLDFVLERLRAIKADGVDMKFVSSITTEDYIRAIRTAGFEFHAWTIDDPGIALEAFRRGAMTVTTNRARYLFETQDGSSVDLPFLGFLAPRSAREVGASNWRLGCETLDRDFASYDAYEKYLAPLGIRVVRLQGGWAKCEKTKGVYDFAWLDRIVDDLLAKGLEPAIETDYGNPVYPGGGGWDLAGGFPTGDEALAAWDAWVDALTRHFATRVSIWMMWNEPDYSKGRKKTPAEIAAFNVRTAKIVKKNIPSARLAGLSLARTDAAFLEDCLAAMGGDVRLFDWIVYHGYEAAPETSYAAVEKLRDVLARYNPTARLWQGENGAPSEWTTKFALSKIPWTELSQAKWNLRRLMGDLGHDVESSVFTICDFNHVGREMNRKGLLRADERHNVLGPKRAYFAVQNLVSVFDASWTRDRDYCATDPTLAAYRYRRASGETATVFWTVRADAKGPFARPGDSLETREVSRAALGLPEGDFEWIDLLTGRVYALPRARATVPVYDSPCVVRFMKGDGGL